MDGQVFARMQRLGRALMLPIAVLPVAGILLRLGQPDVLNISVLAQAGDTLLSNLPLLFAIGVAVGFAKDNNGVAALAGAIGYLVETGVMKTLNDKLDMGVLAGIVAGIVAGALYNWYKDIKLPQYLAFFGGRRFVPIVTALACLVLGLVFYYVWAPVQAGINSVGNWMTTAGALGAFIFGVLNRLLLVTGLHHIIDSLAWFVFGSYQPTGGAAVTGDLHRFFAGDKTAGTFMAGFFPVMMFGLPAACLAMYHEAPRERRALIGGLLLSMALTSFLTGVTEPIEFTFMVLAPALYAIHAVLTGLSMVIYNLLGAQVGFTFSAGAIDYFLLYGLSTKGWLVIPIGLVYSLVYYGLFRFFIRKYKVATPGREPRTTDAGAGLVKSPSTGVLPTGATVRAQAYVSALGGADNLTAIDACTTRLRLNVVSAASVIEPSLKALGAQSVLKRGTTNVQVIIGPEADIIADEMRTYLERVTAHASASVQVNTLPIARGDTETSIDGKGEPVTAAAIDEWLLAFGGRANIASAAATALTRVRVTVVDQARASSALPALTPNAWVTANTLHILCGSSAAEFAQAMQKKLACQSPASSWRLFAPAACCSRANRKGRRSLS